MTDTVAPEAPLSSALDDVAERLRQTMSRVHVRGAEAEESLGSVRTVLGRLARLLSDGDMGESGKGIEIDRVRSLVGAGSWTVLTPAESRFVARTPFDFESHHVGGLLAAKPYLWRTFVRSMLTHWYRSKEDINQWNAYASLTQSLPKDFALVDCPISIARLLGPDGDGVAADSTRASELQECFQTLTDRWRFSARWSLTSFILLAWLRSNSGSGGSGLQALRRLCQGSDQDMVRQLLLPQEVRSRDASYNGLQAWPAVQRGTVALLLEHRFANGRLLGADVFAAIESSLLRGTFGDPRGTRVSDDWDRVKQLVPDSYREFLESLIRADLAFFFHNAMDEADREAFWLRYVGSIQRTVCVLDPETRRSIDASMHGAPEQVRTAISRSYSSKRRTGDAASAFCLFFPRFVVVEFSINGHAAYVYKREAFESHLLPLITSRRVVTVLHLRSDSTEVGFIQRIPHQRGWERRTLETLSRFGIAPDRYSPSSAKRAWVTG